MLLQVTDGTTTISLSGTAPVDGCIYFPKTAQRDKDGRWNNVIESCELFLSGTPAAIRATLTAINRLFVAARQRVVDAAGARVYVEYRPVEGENNARSEVFDGMIEWPNERALRNLGQSETTVAATVRWERQPYWELPRVQLPLTNGAATNTPNYITVWNHDDSGSGHDNYVAIAGTDVLSELPAPIELHLKNVTGADRGYRNFYMALNDFGPAMAHIIEGESATIGTTSISVSTASGGSVGRVSLTANVVAGVALPIPAATLQLARGRYFHLLMSADFTGLAPIYCRAYIRDNTGLSTLAVTPNEVTLIEKNYFQNLGRLPLPPGGDNSAWAAQTLWLEFRSPTTQSFDIDFIQLTPNAMRSFSQLGMLVVSNEVVIDDPVEGTTYFTEAGANHPLYAIRSGPFYLKPGADQRIYILHDGVSRTINWQLGVKVFYRPRRLTV